jgi:hypothetical protein
MPLGFVAALMAIGQDVAERERLIAELRASLTKVEQLSGLLPICPSCQKIRDGTCIGERSEAEFTYGFCPACALRYEMEADRTRSPG